MNYLEEYSKWKNYSNLDDNVRKELECLSETQIKEYFSDDLKFGTGGVREVLAPGPNKLNIYTVRKISKGFALYLLKQNSSAKSVVISYDNRHLSKEFALEAAKVLAYYDIHTYVFDSLRPTPELSFAVRTLKATGGIMITASHNTKEYNGYKIYNDKGCQCVPRETDEIIKYINSVRNLFDIQVADENKMNEFISFIGKEIDEKYYNQLKGLPMSNDITKDFKIVYSPQHGTGYVPVMHMMKELKYSCIEVEEQAFPDENFCNTKSPNPENPISMEKALELAKKEDADLILSTDPDCDRVGIVVKHNSKYEFLNGNQTAAIILNYILNKMKNENNIPKNGVVLNTIVTSSLGKIICSKYDINVVSTLTGFKFLGDKICEYEKTKEKEFIFAYEESYGYLFNDLCRDKDGVQSCVMISNIAMYYKKQGKTLVDVLNNIYCEYGYFLDKLYSINFSGYDSNQKIIQIVEKFRNNNLNKIGGKNIKCVEDYSNSTRNYINSNEKETILLPKSNVIKYIFEDESWLAIRPSGTEPKCKFYFCIRGKNEKDANMNYELIFNDIKQYIGE